MRSKKLEKTISKRNRVKNIPKQIIFKKTKTGKIEISKNLYCRKG